MCEQVFECPALLGKRSLGAVGAECQRELASDIGYARFNIKSGFSRNAELKVVLNFSGGFEVFLQKEQEQDQRQKRCPDQDVDQTIAE